MLAETSITQTKNLAGRLSAALARASAGAHARAAKKRRRASRRGRRRFGEAGTSGDTSSELG
jgi:hypothetical protein